MKAYREEVQLHSFLTLALKEASSYHHLLAALPPGKNFGIYCIGGWVGHTASLDISEKRKISCPYQDFKPWPSSPQQSLYQLCHTGPYMQ